ncbi:endonuclease domain-containing 1 protein-like [Heterodontus francisci]|uniref:endonuclease domain-containing 1 protein-like n=1 Tax=Heterodontus francisci TaxID=7792 RepID=UPI00355B1022
MSLTMRCCSLVLLSVFNVPWATEAKVVSSFDECSQFFCKGVEPLLFKGSNPARICQRYQQQYHFASLDLPGGSDEMSNEPPDGVGMNQALNSDYRNTSYDRGHLYPLSLHSGTGTATCTLTNAVPMLRKMNIAWYHYAERKLKTLANECRPNATMFVMTGVIPSSQFLSNRVNIPIRVYNYYSCCSEDRNRKETEEKVPESGGYSLSVDVHTRDIKEETVTLEKLQEWLGSSIEVNPEWSKHAVSKNEKNLLRKINKMLNLSWAEMLPSLELTDISTILLDAVRFIAWGVLECVAWVIYGVFRVIYDLVSVILGIIGAAAVLVMLLLAAVFWVISSIVGLLIAIFWGFATLVAKVVTSVVNTLLSLITSIVKFLLTSIASILTHIISILTNIFTWVSFSLLQLFYFLLPFFSLPIS